MKKTALYQAIDVGRKAVPQTPIRCSTSDARLGYGYYFWDSIIDAAHWWGEKHYRGNYIICRSFYDAHSDRCFDLKGNLDHIAQLKDCADTLRAEGRQDFTLAEVLEALRKVCPEFDDLYWAIRAEFIKVGAPPDKKLDITVSSRSREKGRTTVIHCGNRVQLCVTNRAFLLEGEYTEIYYSWCRDASYMV